MHTKVYYEAGNDLLKSFDPNRGNFGCNGQGPETGFPTDLTTALRQIARQIMEGRFPG
jgi:hypothetical protein